jgi:hypothetical protein
MGTSGTGQKHSLLIKASRPRAEGKKCKKQANMGHVSEPAREREPEAKQTKRKRDNEMKIK